MSLIKNCCYCSFAAFAKTADDPDLPDYLQARLALAVWTRALLLNNVALKIAPDAGNTMKRSEKKRKKSSSSITLQAPRPRSSSSQRKISRGFHR